MPLFVFSPSECNQGKGWKGKTCSGGPQKHFGTHQSSQAMNDAVGIDGSVSPIFLLFNNTRKHALV